MLEKAEDGSSLTDWQGVSSEFYCECALVTLIHLWVALLSAFYHLGNSSKGNMLLFEMYADFCVYLSYLITQKHSSPLLSNEMS